MGLPSPASTVLSILDQDVGIAHLTAINWRSDMICGLSLATINRRLAALRAIVRLAHRVGAYRDKRGPAFEQVNAILAATDTRRSPALAARDRAIVMLLAARALRCAEAVALQMTDLNLNEGKISITGKGQREATWTTIPPNAVEALRAWLAYRGLWLGPVFIALDRPGRETPLTTSCVRRLMGTLSEEIGVKVRPHGLRHAAITAALDQGYDLRSVQRIARHANPATTMIDDDNRCDFGGEIACSLAEGLWAAVKGGEKSTEGVAEE